MKFGVREEYLNCNYRWKSSLPNSYFFTVTQDGQVTIQFGQREYFLSYKNGGWGVLGEFEPIE